MKKFYVSSHHGFSGISKYSRDFYRLILKEKGYIHIDISQHYSEIFSAISSKDHVHIEIGIFQKKEVEVLMRMIKAKYKNIAVTLHDAPLIKYPFHEFKVPLLNNVSKFYDLHWDNFQTIGPYVRKIKTIYVLSKKGAASVRLKYDTENVLYLPHIVDVAEIEKPKRMNRHFIFFGFIGPNKGIEYSLQLHREMLQHGFSDIQFYIVGTAIGSQKSFFDQLKLRFQTNVHYLGYVPDENLNDIFNQASFALLPFKDYNFFYPASGSVLQSLKKGKVVFTNKVNTVPEIIKNGETGFYLSGNLSKDVETIKQVFENENLAAQIVNNAQKYLINNHSADTIGKMFSE